MMKSYIAIQSTLFNGVIDLVGYTDMQGNIRLTHTSIYAYMSRTFPQMSMEFDVRSTDVNHAVVVCRLRSKIFDGSVRTVTEIGETSVSLLPDKFKGYPVQVAQYIAFDRAAIKYLVFQAIPTQPLNHRILQRMPSVSRIRQIMSWGLESSGTVRYSRLLRKRSITKPPMQPWICIYTLILQRKRILSKEKGYMPSSSTWLFTGRGGANDMEDIQI